MKTKLLSTILLTLISLATYAQRDYPLSSEMELYFFYKNKESIQNLNVNRNVTEAEQRLDSVIGENYREYYYYDNQNRLTEYINYQFVAARNIWKGKYKNIYFYRTHTQPTEIITYHWSDQINGWENYSMQVKSYYDNGKIKTNENYKHYQGELDWTAMDKKEFEYNAQGNITLEIIYEWSTTNYEWTKNKKIEYSYNEHGKILTETTYDWNGDWQYSIREICEYDQYGGNTLQNRLIWSGEDQDWKEYSGLKIKISYNSNGMPIADTLFSQSWGGEWTYLGNFEFGYDAEGRMISNIYTKFDEILDDWIYWYKFERSYDTHGNMINYASYDWDADKGWVGDEKFEITFDHEYTMSQIIFPPIDYRYTISQNIFNHISFWDDAPNFNKPARVNMYSWNLNQNRWESYDINTCYYSGQNPVSIDNTEKYAIELYPNPASENINLMIPEDIKNVSFKLYDMQGKEIISKEIKDNSSSININQLPSGAYFYKLIMDSGIKTGKIVKK